MRNYLAIVKKEMHTLFVSPIAYVVLAVFFTVSGYFFYIITSSIIQRVMEMGFRSQQFGSAPPPIDVPAVILGNFFSVISTILLFLIPMITMGVFAEEKKRGEHDLRPGHHHQWRADRGHRHSSESDGSDAARRKDRAGGFRLRRGTPIPPT